MHEYIEREVAIRALTLHDCDSARAKMAICDIPSSDVAPVRHAKWGVEVGMNFFKERNCPVCKKRIESNFWNFCPNCGALMDGGEQDG